MSSEVEVLLVQKRKKKAKRGRKKKRKKDGGRNSGRGPLVPVSPPLVSVSDAEKLHCICRRQYVRGETMLACDSCGEWFHPRCVKIPERGLSEIKWNCPNCRLRHQGPFGIGDFRLGDCETLLRGACEHMDKRLMDAALGKRGTAAIGVSDVDVFTFADAAIGDGDFDVEKLKQSIEATDTITSLKPEALELKQLLDSILTDAQTLRQQSPALVDSSTLLSPLKTEGDYSSNSPYSFLMTLQKSDCFATREKSQSGKKATMIKIEEDYDENNTAAVIDLSSVIGSAAKCAMEEDMSDSGMVADEFVRAEGGGLQEALRIEDRVWRKLLEERRALEREHLDTVHQCTVRILECVRCASFASVRKVQRTLATAIAPEPIVAANAVNRQISQALAQKTLLKSGVRSMSSMALKALIPPKPSGHSLLCGFANDLDTAMCYHCYGQIPVHLYANHIEDCCENSKVVAKMESSALSSASSGSVAAMRWPRPRKRKRVDQSHKAHRILNPPLNTRLYAQTRIDIGTANGSQQPTALATITEDDTVGISDVFTEESTTTKQKQSSISSAVMDVSSVESALLSSDETAVLSGATAELSERRKTSSGMQLESASETLVAAEKVGSSSGKSLVVVGTGVDDMGDESRDVDGNCNGSGNTGVGQKSVFVKAHQRSDEVGLGEPTKSMSPFEAWFELENNDECLHAVAEEMELQLLADDITATGKSASIGFENGATMTLDFSRRILKILHTCQNVAADYGAVDGICVDSGSCQHRDDVSCVCGLLLEGGGKDGVEEDTDVVMADVSCDSDGNAEVKRRKTESCLLSAVATEEREASSGATVRQLVRRMEGEIHRLSVIHSGLRSIATRRKQVEKERKQIADAIKAEIDAKPLEEMIPCLKAWPKVDFSFDTPITL